MDNRRGIFLMVAAMAAFGAEDALIKVSSAYIPPGQILAILGILGLVFFLALLRRNRQVFWARSALNRYSVIRLAGEVLTSVGFVTGLALIPLTSAAAILQALPLGLTAAAGLFLGERVGWRRWGAVVLGFLGVMMIIQPGGEGFTPASLLIVLAVVGMVVRDVATSLVPRHISSLQLSAWAYGALIPIGLVQSAVTGNAWVVADADQLAPLFGAGVMGMTGYWAVTEAMRMGEVSLVAPFRYTRLIFSMLLAIVFLGERPDFWTLLGAGIIIVTGLYTFWRERRIGR